MAATHGYTTASFPIGHRPLVPIQSKFPLLVGVAIGIWLLVFISDLMPPTSQSPSARLRPNPLPGES